MFNRFSFSADILHSTLCPLCHFMSTTDKSEKKRMKKKKSSRRVGLKKSKSKSPYPWDSIELTRNRTGKEGREKKKSL